MIALTSVLHDPKGKLMELTKNNLGRLRYLFGSFTVVVSKATNPVLVFLLKNTGIDVKFNEEKTYLAYRDALQYGAMSTADHVLLVDFDRLVVWAERHFDELARIKDMEHYEYMLIERSENAFRTYPPTQFETENIANFYISKLLEFEEKRDFLSGAWLFSKELAWHIVENSKAMNDGFHSEWHLLAKKKAKNMGFVQCEGLEWELPYQNKKEIENIGLEAWMKYFEEKDKESRMNNLYFILKEVMDRKN